MLIGITETIIEFIAKLMGLMTTKFVMDGVSIGALFLLSELGVILYVYVLHRGSSGNDGENDE